ncbi:nucleoside-diphosphate sugar epimerase [Geothrix limicola]|uniref:Nucleoside-diphosphate sugar epimerase n=1 Tax=Geothrix limicola TaxID=2927978 RepID=A0ABQ5QFA7_9BACT|nr:polysaccharide biosynthesis protein [Geothrix limicola]GLH73048.1 nucleoside-diphosphate sugar epimerase [Geothrix limicola]
MTETRLIELGKRVTGRERSLFERDYQQAAGRLREAFSGRRILVVGAAGSIGSSTLRCILDWNPEEILLVDTAENNLVEVLRDLRSDPAVAEANLAIQPIDFGSPMMESILSTHPGFDWVFNFAAVKHVRSERDVPSLLQMADTNLLKADRFLGWLRTYGHGGAGVFFVSSDKAANPANLMGASKRMMEQLLFWHGSPEAGQGNLHGEPCGDKPVRCTTARFANVAFSDGSLLLGFLNRIAKRQPLAGPSDIRRYFVTLEEAGQICCLAAVLPAHGEILVPRLSPIEDQKDFREIAALVLDYHRLEPNWVDSEIAARQFLPSGKSWPCYFSPSKAMGEKEYEEFVGAGEVPVEIGLEKLHVVTPPPLPTTGLLRKVFADLAGWREAPATCSGKEQIVDCMKLVVDSLQHVTKDHSLDKGM